MNSEGVYSTPRTSFFRFSYGGSGGSLRLLWRKVTQISYTAARSIDAKGSLRTSSARYPSSLRNAGSSNPLLSWSTAHARFRTSSAFARVFDSKTSVPFVRKDSADVAPADRKALSNCARVGAGERPKFRLRKNATNFNGCSLACLTGSYTDSTADMHGASLICNLVRFRERFALPEKRQGREKCAPWPFSCSSAGVYILQEAAYASP